MFYEWSEGGVLTGSIQCFPHHQSFLIWLMGSVPLNDDGVGIKGMVEPNHHVHDEHKEVRVVVVGEGQGLSEEDESRINEVAVNAGCEGAVQALSGLQKPQQQPQGPVVRWERFLPLNSLKVLLVESDDSTRHVVSALLRNCSYEVTAAANGLQAWKILVDLTNHIDLVLTEVVMPCLSGIGLLCKIMSHKTCKNIPVIMMSSHDSVGIVFKCLSRGAVDFLVKPIRKNELKNLWQHVWRRCHSSSGSGSESGIQTQNSSKSRNVEESDNNTGSNDEDDNGSIGLNVRDGSDNGSGTQSSWTKRAVEIDSPQPMSPWNQLADPPDSTCAQVMYPKPETSGNEWVPVTATREYLEQDEQLESVAMGKDLEIGIPRNSYLRLDYPSEKVSINFTGTKQDKLPELDYKKYSGQLGKGLLELNSEKSIGKMRTQATDLIAMVDNSTNHQVETGISEGPISLSKVSDIKDEIISDGKELPSLDLSLKRLRRVGDVGTIAPNHRNVLRRSNQSAFSRYNTVSSVSQAPIGNVGSCSLLDNSLEALKTKSVHNIPSHSNRILPNQQSNGSSNNDMASTTKHAFTKPAVFNDKSPFTSTTKFLHPSTSQPVQNAHICPTQNVIPEKTNIAVVNEEQEQPKGSHQQVQVQHHHHHYHHYHHHVHNLQQQQQPPDHDDFPLKNLAVVSPQCGSSNVFAGPVERNGGNYSLNGSASGSNHGSNGQNGSSTAVNIEGINMESDNGMAGKSGAGGSSGSGSGSKSRVDQNRFAQRVAALTKFRQKRKERCFGKKVRYQNRKKLAEQRPRVRGQFVRQTVYEHTSHNAD